MVKSKEQILALLPYAPPFLFVDELLSIDENGVTGTYIYNPDADFYKGHFKDYPVTPGVILTETMAQTGLVCLGIYLLEDAIDSTIAVALTSAETEFLKPVFPGEKVTVTSEKIYFRFGKLKCRTQMKNEKGETVCTATIAGMLTSKL
jgi:3-hydroxyacyl-[acyl-carrier-protein] dehydratase